jgi:hypothetical protein
MAIRLITIALALVSLSNGYALKSDAEKNKEIRNLKAKVARLTPVEISAPISSLSDKDKQAIKKIIAAAKLMNPIYSRQVWSGNEWLRAQLAKDSSEQGLLKLKLFDQNRGPWDRMESNKAFLNDVPKEKVPGGGYYPEDMTKAEFESWLKGLSEPDKVKAQGFFSVIHRDQEKKLYSVNYSQEYKEFLKPAAELLKEAAELTDNSSLKRFLNLRAEAFLTDNYYESDVAWMDLDAPVEVTIGPYETYEDELYGYKAAFEAFVTLTNVQESQKLNKFSSYLQELENNLPIEEKFRNKKIGSMAPIRVVDEVYTSGEARRGVATAAFNLPNDEKVIKEKGSKRVMLKNVQQAKFDKVLSEISKKVLSPKDQKEVQFEPFFTHILMHELMHGIGPHNIKLGERETNVRMELKDQYSSIEEAKADITGLFALQYLMDKGVIDKSMQRTMYTTFLASSFRSVRFGITEAHGRGVAMQFNFLMDEGAITQNGQGKFSVNMARIQPAVKKLTHELLTLQAEGAYEKAKAMLTKYGVVRPAMQEALNSLKDVPVDIDPIFSLE